MHAVPFEANLQAFASCYHTPGFESNRRPRHGVRLGADSASARNPQPSANNPRTSVKKVSSGQPRQVSRRTGFYRMRRNPDFTHPLDREMFHVSGTVLI